MPTAYSHLPAAARVALLLHVALFYACAGGAQEPSASELSVSVFFGRDAVWQRDRPVDLRGTGSPGARVRFASEGLGEGSARVGEDGRWVMRLSPKPAGGPHAYTLTSGGQTLRVGDVYVGDVFVCSGQSNMEWPVDMTEDRERATAVVDPLLHHLIVPHHSTPEPQAEPLGHAFWQTAYPGRTQGFTAIGYYFAEELRRRDPSVPIGLINASWGGSPIEAWLPDATPAPSAGDEAAQHRARWAELRAAYPEAFTGGGRELRPGGAGGEPIALGTPWEYAGFPGVNGVMWFERDFSLSDRQVGRPMTLSLGTIDDADSTFVNGRFVGAMTRWNEPRRYTVPAEYLRPGRNRLSVRVRDDGGGGGFGSPADSVYLDTGIGAVRLAGGDGGWRVRPARISYDSLGEPHVIPRFLYNGMLAPLAGVRARGVLWYQGESNATDPARARAYGEQIRALVGHFRRLGDAPELPFVAVELPEWLAFADVPYQTTAAWPHLRQATRSVLSLPSASTVVALGYGDADDIHPRDKRPVAIMLAEEMARLTYGSDDEPRNSWPTEVTPMGGATLAVRFGEVGPGGLTTTDGMDVRGFAVQDDAGAWHYATATVTAPDVVRLVGPSGKTLRAVAYAWADNPAAANLVNGHGRRVGSWERGLGE